MHRSPGPERQSVPPNPGEERTTERRMIPAAPQNADSSRDVAQEDFLFHLYRGSELLQENRVLEAKEELEFALTMQPSDPKGQDLLGAVYFRLGLYPRAIQIYDALERGFPNDASIKINLALCYLKTGQPEPARRALQDAVRINPEHRRAWGYLGLALQKLGDLEGSQIAFERGGHSMMARRVTERRARVTVPAPSQASSEVDDGVRSVAATAFSELDAGELRFALAETAGPAPAPSEDRWHTLEPGDAARVKSPHARTLPPPAILVDPSAASVHETVTMPPAPLPGPQPTSTRLVPPPMPAAPEAPPSHAPPLFDLAQGEVVLRGKTLLVRTGEDQAFAARLDALRVASGAVGTRVLHRRTRDADTSEVLGGLGSPFVRVSGEGQLALAARPAHPIVLLALSDEMAFVREEMLLGFELRLAYENGRLALDPPGEAARPQAEGAPVVQLRGSGTVALELGGELAGVACVSGRPLVVRREWIVGWLGRLVPRALPPAEAPNGQRGLIAFSGEGTVLVCVG